MAEVSLPTKRAASSFALPSLDVTRAGLIIACVFFFGAAMVSTTDPDYWWHLRTGHLIVDKLAIPTTDPFSFTLEGKHWVAHEWLSEVIIYGTQSLGGYGLALVLFASAGLGTLLLTYRTSLRLGASRQVALLFFVWAGVMTCRTGPCGRRSLRGCFSLHSSRSALSTRPRVPTGSGCCRCITIAGPTCISASCSVSQWLVFTLLLRHLSA